MSNSYKDKKKIIVDEKERGITEEKEHIKIILDFFNEMFHRKVENELHGISPTQMRVPFPTEELKPSIGKLKNGKIQAWTIYIQN